MDRNFEFVKRIFSKYSIPLEQNIKYQEEKLRIMSLLSFSIFCKTCGFLDHKLEARDVAEIFSIAVKPNRTKRSHLMVLLLAYFI
eukprot:UN00715